MIYKYFRILIGVLFIINSYQTLSAQEKTENLSSKNISGKVKSIKEISYDGTENFGELKKGKLTGIIFFEYNEVGNLIKETQYDEKGKISYITNYKYDSRNNLIEKSSQSIGIWIVYNYDDNGKCIQSDELKKDKSLKFRTKHKYNPLGYLIESNTYNSQGKHYRKSLFKYDEEGNQTEISWYKNGQLTYNVHKVYNQFGNVTRVDNVIDLLGERGNIMLYDYDDRKNVIGTTYINPDGSIRYNLSTAYDSYGNVISENSNSEDWMNQYETKNTYDYDEFSNWITCQEISHGPLNRIRIIERQIIYF